MLYIRPEKRAPFDDPDLDDALSKCIFSFIDNGLDPNTLDSDGKSILECAIPFCPSDFIEMLLQRGAKITPNLLTETGELLPTGSDILRTPKYNRPEFYTPEARNLARRHNPDWPQDSQQAGLLQRMKELSLSTAMNLVGLGTMFGQNTEGKRIG